LQTATVVVDDDAKGDGGKEEVTVDRVADAVEQSIVKDPVMFLGADYSLLYKSLLKLTCIFLQSGNKKKHETLDEGKVVCTSHELNLSAK
jgi:RecA-family ATPase